MENKIKERIKNLKISANINKVVATGCTLVAMGDVYTFVKEPNFSTAILGIAFGFVAFEQANRAYCKENEIIKYEARLEDEDKELKKKI